jgi:hypothetical protein
MYKRIGLGSVLIISLVNSGCASFFYTGQHPSVAYHSSIDHMSDEIRRSVHTVEVVADNTKPGLRVGGDYGQFIPTTGEGAAEGVAAGAKVSGAMLAEDPRAIFLMPIILPVMLIAGGIGGAAAAKIEKELAEFREDLADDIVADGSQPLPSDVFASALINRLDSSSDIVSVADGGDASLTVSITDISINTQKEDATITTFAIGILRNAIDDSVLYEKSIRYSERDKLRNWTANENALWADYVERARQYLAAEVIADMFEKIRVRHVLRPVESDSFSGGRNGRAKTRTPTFSWEFFLLGGDPYDGKLDEQHIAFDLRIYDGSRLAYEARRIRGTTHEVSEALPPCSDLRWTVRPVFQMEGETRAGDWMQFRSGFNKFLTGGASGGHPGAPEFWQAYAEVRTRCSS